MPQQPSSPAPTHRNHFLFSDHYLNEVLPTRPEWQVDCGAALARAKALWQEWAPLMEGQAEATLEQHLIQPLFREVLGLHFEHRHPAAVGPGHQEPDYTFFPDAATRKQALTKPPGSREFLERAIALGDAKRMGTPLGRKSGPEQNPTAQVCHYLYHFDVTWGVLTDGRFWRLYHEDASRGLEAYYEVNLEELLASGDAEAFRYFQLFLRREAFAEGFLDNVLRESREYALGLGNTLRANVYEALQLLIEGFLSFPRNQLTPADLQLVHDNALVVLYRVLFVFYAESRGLLPVSDSRYASQVGFEGLKHRIAEELDSGVDHAATFGNLWHRALEVFQLIDQGSAEFAIPQYNGGLFSARNHPRITLADGEAAPPGVWQVGDRYFARVLDLLARDQSEQGRQFVDYRSLGVRHLGSIYEGLLEMQPRLVDGVVDHVSARGERKASGSYYTPDELVDLVCDRALRPLLERAAEEVAAQAPALARQVKRRQKAIEVSPTGRAIEEQKLRDLKLASVEPYLSLKVLDPAMGSGHFLVAAMERIAAAIVQDPNRHAVESDDGIASDAAFYRRLVAERCLYGVDLNPLAVELAKVSIWLASISADRPLSFLDHHLRTGDSLIGAWWKDVQTDPRARRNHKPGNGPAQGALFDETALARDRRNMVALMREMQLGPSETREDVQRKGEALDALERAVGEHLRPAYDLWTSLHFGNETNGADLGDARRLVWGQQAPTYPEKAQAILDRAHALARNFHFFHWELAFPEVFFDDQGREQPEAGFDAVIGNPPWERTDFEELQFFGPRNRAVTLAPTSSARKELIAALETADPQLWQEYQDAQRRRMALREWLASSGRFPLTGEGRPNLYAVFAELGRTLVAGHGRVGVLVPSGIATDNATKGFFGDLVESQTLQALVDFENRKGLFPDVDRRFKFTVMVMTGGQQTEEIECASFLHGVQDLADPERVFTLRPEDFALMNPNTRTCPVFRTRRDAEITRSVYQRVPVLVQARQEGPERNAWAVSLRQGLFNLASDSGLFRTADDLEAEGFWLAPGNVWRKGSARYVPLYEGKMVQMYDHRAASVVLKAENVYRPRQPAPTSPVEHQDPNHSPRPQFWVRVQKVDGALGGAFMRWFLAFKDVTAPTNERTMIAAAIPRAAVGHSLPLLLLEPATSPAACCLLANLCSIPLDYVARQKVGGQHLTFFVVEQLPVFPPAHYDHEWHGVRLADFIGERVLELTYTAHDIAGFAEDMGYVDEEGKVKPPFPWDEERRLHLRCQLDALFFHLYGLPREDADYILNTFPIVKRHDLARFGRYRTKDLILQYYSAYAAGDMEAWVKA